MKKKKYNIFYKIGEKPITKFNDEPMKFENFTTALTYAKVIADGEYDADIDYGMITSFNKIYETHTEKSGHFVAMVYTREKIQNLLYWIEEVK